MKDAKQPRITKWNILGISRIQLESNPRASDKEAEVGSSKPDGKPLYLRFIIYLLHAVDHAEHVLSCIAFLIANKLLHYSNSKTILNYYMGK